MRLRIVSKASFGAEPNALDRKAAKMNSQRLVNYAAFVALMVSTGLGVGFLWGLLFLFWTVWSIRSRRTILVFDVSRDEDPFLFWLIQAAWAALGVIMILSDFYPALS